MTIFPSMIWNESLGMLCLKYVALPSELVTQNMTNILFIYREWMDIIIIWSICRGEQNQASFIISISFGLITHPNKCQSCCQCDMWCGFPNEHVGCIVFGDRAVIEGAVREDILHSEEPGSLGRLGRDRKGWGTYCVR